MDKTDRRAGQPPAQNDESHIDEEVKVVVVVDGKQRTTIVIFGEDWPITEVLVDGDPGNFPQGNENSCGTCDPFKRKVLLIGAASIVVAGGISVVSGNLNYLTTVAAIAVPALLWVFGN